MKLAVIGLGGIAEKGYLPYITGLDQTELFFHSRHKDRVDELRTRYRVTDGSNRFDDVLHWQPDAALILTPSETHFPLAMELMKNGIDVFMEKPVSYQSEENHVLSKEADRLNRILMVGYNRRFAPLTVQARELWNNRPVSMGVMVKNRSSNIFAVYRSMSMKNLCMSLIPCAIFAAMESGYNPASAGKGWVTGGSRQPDPVGFRWSGDPADLPGRWFVAGELCLARGKTSMELDMFSELRMFEGGKKTAWRNPMIVL